MADMMTQGAPSADPTAAAPEATAPDTSNGYVIEIRVTGDGKFAVGVEPMAAEAAEGVNDADQFQQVANLGEAMNVVRDIVKNAGQMADTGAGADEMAAGYGSNS